MIVEPGQVFLVQHNGRVDPFLVLGQRELYHDGRVFKWTVLNLSTGESLYVYDDELVTPDPSEAYCAIERLF